VQISLAGAATVALCADIHRARLLNTIAAGRVNGQCSGHWSPVPPTIICQAACTAGAVLHGLAVVAILWMAGNLTAGLSTHHTTDRTD